MTALRLDRANTSKVAYGTGAPTGSTRGNIYLDQTNGLLYVKASGGSWYVCGDKLWTLSGSTITNRDNRALAITTTGNITFDDQYLSTAISLSQTGTTGLSGFTATSIIGGMNELRAAIGGAGSFTTGSVIFADGSGNLAQDNANFSWNDSTNVLTVNKFIANDVSAVVDGGVSSNRVVNSLSFGFDTATDEGWIQVYAAAAGDVLYLNPEGGDVTVGSNTAAIALNAATASNFTVSGATADLTLGARGTTITLNENGSTALVGFTATSIIGALNEVKTGLGLVTLDNAYNASAGASTVTVDAGDMTWSLKGAYSFVISLTQTTGSVDGFTIEDGSDYFRILTGTGDGGDSSLYAALYDVHLDGNNLSLDFIAASNITVSGASADLTLGARGATVTLNQNGSTALVGFTATSIIGGLNELKTGIAAYTLDDAYNASAGASSITVDAGDVTWSPKGAYSFVVSLTQITGGSDGFTIEDGADYFRILTGTGDGSESSMYAELYDAHIDSNNISLDASAASNITVSGASADLTLGARGATITLNENGQTVLSGYSATSIIGAFNEVMTELDTHEALLAEAHGTFEVVSAATDTFTATELGFLVTRTATGTCIITISSAEIAKVGRVFIVKDAGQNASVYNITINTEGAETIDGNSNATISSDGDSLSFVSDGSNLHII